MAAVDELLFGPAVPDAPNGKPKPRTAAIIQRTATREELLAGAQYCIDAGKPELMTAEQAEALKTLHVGK